MVYPEGRELSYTYVYFVYLKEYRDQSLHFESYIKPLIDWMTSTAAYSPLLSQLRHLERYRLAFLPEEMPKWEYVVSNFDAASIIYNGANREHLQNREDTNEGKYIGYFTNLPHFDQLLAVHRTRETVGAYPKPRAEDANGHDKDFQATVKAFVEAYHSYDHSDEKQWRGMAEANASESRKVKTWKSKHCDFDVEASCSALYVSTQNMLDVHFIHGTRLTNLQRFAWDAQNGISHRYSGIPPVREVFATFKERCNCIVRNLIVSFLSPFSSTTLLELTI